jgi:hypothetical protein
MVHWNSLFFEGWSTGIVYHMVRCAFLQWMSRMGTVEPMMRPMPCYCQFPCAWRVPLKSTRMGSQIVYFSENKTVLAGNRGSGRSAWFARAPNRNKDGHPLRRFPLRIKICWLVALDRSRDETQAEGILSHAEPRHMQIYAPAHTQRTTCRCRAMHARCT